jgi:hypothetical protein
MSQLKRVLPSTRVETENAFLFSRVSPDPTAFAFAKILRKYFYFFEETAYFCKLPCALAPVTNVREKIHEN